MVRDLVGIPRGCLLVSGDALPGHAEIFESRPCCVHLALCWGVLSGLETAAFAAMMLGVMVEKETKYNGLDYV